MSKVKVKKPDSFMSQQQLPFSVPYIEVTKIDGMIHKVASKSIRDVGHPGSSILTFIPILPLHIL